MVYLKYVYPSVHVCNIRDNPMSAEKSEFGANAQSALQLIAQDVQVTIHQNRGNKKNPKMALSTTTLHVPRTT